MSESYGMVVEKLREKRGGAKIQINNPHVGVTEIQIVCADCILKTDHNGFIANAHINKFDRLGKSFQGLCSDASLSVPDEGVYIFRTDDEDIRLSKEELIRFALRDLKPQEFKNLYAAWGSTYLLHEDFYCPETGESFQPVG